MKRILLVILVIVSPAHGQKHRMPDIPVPAQWTDGRVPSGTDVVDCGRMWWRAFDDPILSSLIKDALESNPDLKTSAARIMEAQALRRGRKSALRPSIEVTQQYSRVGGGLTKAAGGVTGPFPPAGLQIRLDSAWQGDLAGGLRSDVKAADADVRVAEAMQDELRIAIPAEVARHYVSLRGAQRQIDILQQHTSLQQEFLRLTQARKDAGLASQSDVELAAADLRRTIAELAPIKAQIDRTAHSISSLLGRAPTESNIELLAQRPIPAIPENPRLGVPSELLLRRPDLRGAAAELSAAMARLDAAQAEQYPRMTLAGLVGRHAASAGALALSNFFSIGPVLHLPLFTGGRVRSNVDVHEARLQQAIHRYEAAVFRALAEVEDALSALRYAKERDGELETVRAHLTEAKDLSIELYSKGLGDYLAVIDAQQELLKTEQSVAENYTEMTLQMIGLYVALGGAW